MRRFASTELRPILVYVATAYTLAIALSILIVRTGSQATPLAWGSMVLPTIAVVLAREPAAIDWSRFSLRYLPAALLLMPAVLHAVMVPAARVLGGGIAWKSDSAGHVAVNALFGLLFVSALAMFEEVGWRAWLLPRLTARIGTSRAIAAVSLIWALWHIPFVLSGILRPEHLTTAQAVAILPIGQFGAGLVLGWLWMRTGSIWIVSLAHGSLNNWGQYAFKLMQDNPALNSYEATVLLAGSLALAGAGIVLLMVRRP